MKTKLSSLGKRVLLIAGSIIFTFLLLEVVIRIVAPGSLHDQNYRIYDPKMGYKFIPNLDTTVDSGQGAHKIITNDYGFVGPNFTLEKPLGEYRIANIGDSYVEGLQQVDWDQNFVALLGKQFPNTESLNFGISGRGTLEEYWTDKYLASKANPDLTILWFTLANDFGNNYLPDQLAQTLTDNTSGTIKYLFKKSALFTFIFEHTKGNPTVAKLLREFHLTNAVVTTNKNADGPQFEDEINYSIDGSYDKEQAQAYATTDDLLAKFKSSVEAGGGKFLVVIIPFYLNNAEFKDEFFALNPDANPAEYDYSKPSLALKALLDKNKIRYLDLTESLSAYVAGKSGIKDCGPLFGNHFTACGHQVTSEIVGTYIKNNLL